MDTNKASNIGRTPKVSEVEIIEAGKKLLAINKDVTGFSLKKLTGGKGDPIRHRRIWDEYINSQPRENQDSSYLTPEVKKAINEATSSISKTFESLVQQIYLKANGDAQEHINSAINLADTRKKKADAEIQDAVDIIEEMDQVLSTLEGTIGENDYAIEDLRLKNAELVNRVENLTQEAQEQLELLKLASSENDDLIQAACRQQEQSNLIIQNNLDLKADKILLLKEIEDLKQQLLSKTDEHDLKIGNILDKLEGKLDDAA